jgi:outer membrane protein TolC
MPVLQSVAAFAEPASKPLVAASAEAAQPPLNLSLDQAIALGTDRSLALRNSSLLLAESRALQGLARARFMPKLDLVALGTYAQVGTDVGFISNLPAIGDLNFDLGGDGYAVVQNTFVNVGLALTMPLIDFGRGPLQQAARASSGAPVSRSNPPISTPSSPKR